MPYPVLAASNTWYKGNIGKETITAVSIVNSHTPTGREDEVWNADTANSGDIKCYRTGTEIIIAGNGTGKIYANEDSSHLFDGFEAVVTITCGNLLDTSNSTNMSYMFQFCFVLESVDVSTWDTSNSTTIRCMFQGAMAIGNIDVSNWNTSNVVDMMGMFNMSKNYFNNSLTSLDVSNWDVSKVTDMRQMFYNCSALAELDVSRWRPSACEDMAGMFNRCYSLTELDVSNWDVSNVTDMNQTFYMCNSLVKLDISNWDVSKVTIMKNMFCGCSALTELDVSNWDVSNVTNFCNMFASGGSYGENPMILPELDVSKWDTSSCTDMSFMFYGCQGPKTIDVSNWDVSNVANFDHMTAHSYLVFEGVDNWAPSSKCTNMNAMFHSLQNTSIDVSKYDTSNVTVFDQMFQNAYELTEVIGLENFNTSNGVGFSEMFQHCYNIQELNLSSFDTTHAKDGEPASTNGSFTTTMSLMFQDMYKLQKISIGKKFSFKGDGTGWDGNYAVLPTPSTEYIEGANGNWYDIDKTPYAAANVPDETVATYYASPDLAEKEDNELVLVKQGSLIRAANAIRAKNNLYEQYKPSEFANGIYDIDIDTHLATVFNGEAEEIVSDKITKIFISFQANNKNLEKVDLPLITKLPDSCFAQCSNLTSVNCPAVTEIEAAAMEGCNVTELIFPECVTIKGWGWTFAANHNLIKAVFPKLTNITSASFALCGSLKALVLGSSSVVTLGEGNVFNESGIATGTGYVYVPRNLVESYKVAEHWSTYASQIRALEDYTVDGTTTGELDPTKI